MNNKCWWCREYGKIPLRVFTIHGCESITVKYCPLCGKKIESKKEENNNDRNFN